MAVLISQLRAPQMPSDLLYSLVCEDLSSHTHHVETDQPSKQDPMYIPWLTTDAAGAHLNILKGGGRVQVDAHDCVAQGGRQDHVDKPSGAPNGRIERGQEGCLVGVQCIAAASTRAGQEGAQRENAAQVCRE